MKNDLDEPPKLILSAERKIDKRKRAEIKVLRRSKGFNKTGVNPHFCATSDLTCDFKNLQTSEILKEVRRRRLSFLNCPRALRIKSVKTQGFEPVFACPAQPLSQYIID
jgi:hypothetical protein